MTRDLPQWQPQTEAIRAGLRRTSFSETSEALMLSSGFVYASAAEAEGAFATEAEEAAPRFVYSRFSNPTVAMFEERLAAMHAMPSCHATASGMAAVFAALACQLGAGDRVVASRVLFGSCQYVLGELLPRFGIETVFVDGADPGQWRRALTRPTACVFVETPANPTLEIVDLGAVAELAHGAGARLIVDNALAGPTAQRPEAFGADIVVYSATKHIDGQGRCLGGAILSETDFRIDLLEPFLRHTGPTMSAFNAWVLLKGLETLELRGTRHCDNAEAVAEFLAQHPMAPRVIHPALATHPQFDLAQRQMIRGGSVVAFELADKDAAFGLIDRLELIDISNNLGDAKSLITHPATTTHQRIGPDARRRQGIGDGLLRLSVGLEDVRDIIGDLAHALDGDAPK